MSLRGRVLWVSGVSLLMVFMAVPSLVPERIRLESSLIPDSGVSLGLDLQGGIHWLLAVDRGQAYQKRIETIATDLGDRVREGEKFGTVKPLEGAVLEVCGADPAKVEELDGDPRLQRVQGQGDACPRYALNDAEKRREVQRGADQATEVIRRRVSGVQEPIITRQGDDRILVQLPGGDIDPVRARKMITGTTFLEFKKVLAFAENEELLKSRFPEGLPEDSMIVKSAEKDEVLLVPREPVLTGTSLEDARLQFDRMGVPVVSFAWNSDGTRKFREFTKENIGQRLAAIIDGEVITAPVIRSEIGHVGQIEGNFKQAEATDLAMRLRSGSLPITLRIEEERTVGPGLGADSIRAGVLSTVFGGLAVLVLTSLYYGFSGVLASITLILNLFIVLGFMGAFEATLTLPGIAGLALTVGMAVDSNIIVFERIRDELRAGRTVRSAVSIGFKKSILTILDANITTLIAAMVLYYVGRGPIQGFGVTLAVGIAATVFCALTVTQLLIELTLDRGRRLGI
jgi:protein-export membrane protein SecD